jgi:hypothetical protein
MKIGDLVRFRGYIGIVTCLDPEEIGDEEEVMVLWNNSELCSHTTRLLEVISERTS